MKSKRTDNGGKNISGKRIRYYRTKSGMQQKDLLMKLWQNGMNLDASSLSKIEGQTRRVLDYELLMFAKILEVRLEDLLSEKENNAEE